MRVFLCLWLGQMLSMFGSQLTGFGLGVWVFTRTRSTLLFALVVLATQGPSVVLSPLAGVAVDRLDRRRVLLAGYSIGGACSVAMALLYSHRLLAYGWVLLLVALSSSAMTVEYPALTASTTLLVPPHQHGRANGLLQFGEAIARLSAPMTGGILLPRLGVDGLIAIDVASFLFAIVLLLAVRIPSPDTSAAGRDANGSVWEQTLFGWRYIRRHRGLLGLLGFFTVLNFLLGAVQVLITPLVLGFADSRTLGTVLSAGGLGMIAGSLLMVAWGGPKRRMNGVFASFALIGISVALTAVRPSAVLVGVGAFGVLFGIPVSMACNNSLWQRIVPQDVQGRVFASRWTIAGAFLPFACLCAGPACDRIFEPSMAPHGVLAGSIGVLLGVGPGRGAALFLLVLGALLLVAAALGIREPRLRRLDDQPVDHPLS